MREPASSIANGIPSSRPSDLLYRVRLIERREVRRDSTGAFCEQRHCRRVDAASTSSERHWPHSLVCNTKSLTAGGKTLHRRRLARIASIRSAEASRRARSCRNQQPDSALLRSSHRVAHRSFPAVGDAQHRGDRVGTAADRTAANSKSQTPSGFRRRSHCTSSASRVLPTPPIPVNVTRRCASHRRLDFVELRLAPDETRRLLAAGSQAHIQRPQRRKLSFATLVL